MPETAHASSAHSRSRAAHVAAGSRPPLLNRLLRGPDTDPAWYRPALLALLLGTAVLYLVDLSASGYANSFYAAAVQAGSENWKAWFFGSLDSSNFITVDKPPASLWVMGLSGRIFGFSSWSMLVPEALMGVAAVGLLAATVRRVVRSAAGAASGAAAGLIAGAALALTPAAVLIFRFNNPDAFMVLLLVIAAYCVTRAMEGASLRWLLGAGVAVGFGFLTKSGEALLPVPAFALAYLVAAPASLWRRIGQLIAAGVAVVVSAGWWIVTVLAWPADARPYIGGSTDNNPLQLAFGYNGLSRLFGNSGGGPGGTGGGAARVAAGFGGAGGGPGGGGTAGGSFGGTAGLQRLFGDEFGREISWLLPAAVILLLAGLWLTLRRPRTDLARAGLIVFGGWLLIVGVTFAYMQGTIHPYYTVALAPAIGAVVGIGGVLAWHHARQPRVSPASVAAPAPRDSAATQTSWPQRSWAPEGTWAPENASPAQPPWLENSTPEWLENGTGQPAESRPGTHRTGAAQASPRTAYLLLAVAVIVNCGWDFKLLRDNSSFHPSLASITLAVAAVAIVALAGVALWSRAGRRLVVVTAALTGLALAVPSAAWAFGTAATPHTGSIPTAVSGTGSGGGFGGGGNGTGTAPGAAGITGEGAALGDGAGASSAGGTSGTGQSGASGTATRGGAAGGDAAGGGNFGGGGASASSALAAALRKTTTRWAAAVEGSQSAASLELASGGKAVMAMGGFTGSDPAPTLAQFEAWANAGDITYYIAGGQGGGPGGGSSSQITSWVEAHFESTTIGGQTVYLLLSKK